MRREEPSWSSSVAGAVVLRRLLEEHGPKLLAMLRRRIDPALAARLDPEEVLQEAFPVGPVERRQLSASRPSRQGPESARQAALSQTQSCLQRCKDRKCSAALQFALTSCTSRHLLLAHCTFFAGALRVVFTCGGALFPLDSKGPTLNSVLTACPSGTKPTPAAPLFSWTALHCQPEPHHQPEKTPAADPSRGQHGEPRSRSRCPCFA
jgi:hypothetical protein